MKKIVFIALMISFFYSIYIAYEQMKNEEIEKLATLEKEFATPFIIPEDESLSNPKSVYPLLLKSANEADVNLFRGARYFRPDEQIEMTKYILLTGETNLFSHIKVDSGRVLHEEETHDSQLFLSSIQTNNKNQVGKIHYFDPKQIITIHSLQSSYDYLPVNGRYFAEAKDDEKFQLFLETFTKKINTYLIEKNGADATSYTTKDLQPPEAFMEPSEGFFAQTSGSGKQFEQLILFSITLLLLVYYIFNSVRRIGILKMHGISNLRLWWIITGRDITITVAITILGVLLFVLGLQLPVSLIYKSFLQIGQAYIIILIMSMLCYVYISTIKVSQTIKNRKDTQAIFILNMVLKVICAIVLIQLILQTYTSYVDLRIKQERIRSQEGQVNNWGGMENYGIAKAHAGYTTAYTHQEFESDMSRLDKALYELYPAFNAMGALYIDTKDYEQSSLILNQGYSGILSITVNPNYLKAYPIYDHNGNPVQLSEETTDWVLLVPEKYRKREKEIRQYFDEDKETRNFYLMKDEGQKMKIIWVKSDQNIFSLNPDVFPEERNSILDPIIQVKTEQNHLFTYRSGIKGFGLNDPLKVKLIDQDPVLTYEKIKPKIERQKLDNVITIVSFKQYVSEELDNLYQEMKNAFFTMLGIIGIFIFLIVQNLLIIFHKHQKRLVIKRLFGIGFIKTYQSVFVWMIITSGAYVIISFLMNQTQNHPTDKQLIKGIMDPHFLVIILSLLCIELLSTVIALTIIERRNKIVVIKGGD
ncbi:hypothetical protein [Peribacillus butanolivorans]|uniref:hypothetical protein n=1 Tax=Peribacillus butanolivorans TaxID=421767 RepID=UPI0035DD7994